MKEREQPDTRGSYCLRREQWIGRPLEEVFEFFSQPKNLQALTPAWLNFRIRSVVPAGAMEAGTVIEYSLRWRIFPIWWRTEIIECDPPHKFVDLQRRGPYALWLHEHSFFAENGGTLMVDEVHYRLPLGPLGRIAHKLRVRRDVEAIFDFRAAQMATLFPAR